MAWQCRLIVKNLRIYSLAPLENWTRPPGRPRTTWMKTIHITNQPSRYIISVKHT